MKRKIRIKIYTKQTKYIKLFQSFLSIPQKPMAVGNNYMKLSFISQASDQDLDSAQQLHIKLLGWCLLLTH